MTTLTNSLRQLRCPSQLARAQWCQPIPSRSSFQFSIRSLTTDSSTPEQSGTESTPFSVPFQGVKHARAVPISASYFSREPQFNDLYIAISRLLTKYHHLPTLAPNEVPQTPWIKLDEIRSKLGEPIKSAHFAKVMRVARRLNQIEPSLFPKEVKIALAEFQRDIDPFSNVPSVGFVDPMGRAVATGKRKESTARAWVVEGTGEVLINGKTLSQAFGRVHDRESAIWALQATQRLDKYNVWALVEGGGTTGQAEALTLAVAKALVIHEPALKTALRKAGCITRDPRTVERKKHGHVKARKMPAWVKR
ncbi:ribosomal protein S5 domain 2-type protein [Dactylonectria estremocensis]|uniref:Small ribosomal subunit protein uS9m n=1 Tax=Dactylonectria estremocensis TaxID=1079267 RepID=A0A9P9F0Y1_9HYPO|nr:ribosomal protein S5 domain 2-type protein [Dactylonectria estremocensis]